MATYPPGEDLFEDTRMSFGAHLEELRKVLVKALIGVTIGCVIGFYFANDIVALLNRPLIEALVQFKNDRARERLVAEEGFLAPELVPWLEDDRRAPETVYLDPGQLVELLRSVSPDFFGGVELDPYRFSGSDLDPARVPALARTWERDRQSSGVRGRQLQYLWDQLNASEQAAVAELAGASDSDGDAARKVAAAVGRLINESRLFEAEPFAVEMESPASSWWGWLLGGTPSNPLSLIRENLEAGFDPGVNQRLNRVLLTGLFPEQLPEVRLAMMPVQIWRRLDVQPQSLNPTESFLIWIKAGMIAGLLIASPWVLYQLWTFVAAGLYPHEKKYVHVFLPTSLALFFSGAALAFGFVFQPVLAFLFTFNAQMGIDPQPRINEWLSFVLFLPLGFGIAFQLPLVMLFLNRINVFSVDAYLGKWRIAVMAIFALSMVLTPADPISMILLAVPLTGLYFLGIGLCVWFPGARNPFEPIDESPAPAG